MRLICLLHIELVTVLPKIRNAYINENILIKIFIHVCCTYKYTLKHHGAITVRGGISSGAGGVT